jgi:hypothetical protein
VSVRKFSDIVNELAAPLSKGADYLAVSLRIVRWVRENWLAGKLDIFGRLNGGGVLKVVRPDPFLDFFREVERTELVWRIRYLPEGSRLPREGFWGDLAISGDAATQLRDAITGQLPPADEHAGAAASIRRPGPKAGETNRVRRQQESLVPILEANRREGESGAALVRRLMESKEISLPGAGDETNRIQALVKVWNVVRGKTNNSN